MSRPPRIEVPGVPLHIVQRGNDRADCFFGDIDRRYYLKCLAEAASARGCEVHAYVLMSNHVHLLVTPKTKGAASAMLQDLGRKYVRTVNRAHGRTGTLWEGRFKSSLIDTEKYLFACHRYIELNPVRAGMATAPADYPWSSHAYYAGFRPDRVITPHRLYTALSADPEARRSALLAMFKVAIPQAETESLRTAINRGWALGSEPFLAEMQRQLGRSIRPPRRGRPLKKDGEKATRSAGQPEMLL
jgi:putative transposase